MRLTWLGWAGVELEADGATVVDRPARRRGARCSRRSASGRRATPLPRGRRAERRAGAVAGLVTHLHRDHADARRARRGARARRAGARAAGRRRRARSRSSRSPRPSTSWPRPASSAGGSRRGSPSTGRPVHRSPRSRRSTASATRRSPGSSRRTACACCTSATRCSTATGGAWRCRHGPFDVVLVPVNGAVVGFPHRRPASPLPVVLDPDAGGDRRRDPRRRGWRSRSTPRATRSTASTEPVAGRRRALRRPPPASAACPCGILEPRRDDRDRRGAEPPKPHQASRLLPCHTRR